MPERCLVVAASNVLRRGLIAIAAGHTSQDKEPTHALFGLTRALLRALALKTPARAVAVVDRGFMQSELTDEVAVQRRRIVEVMNAHGLEVVEAEDELRAVATYARSALDDGNDVVLVGSDKRFAQLVGPGVWWYDAYKDARYTVEMVEKRFLVPPAQVAEWIALVGDDDAMPGIKGIGKKGATTLLEEYGSVDKALEDLDNIKGRTGNALRAAGDTILPEVARGRLDSQAELPRPWGELGYNAPDSASLNQLYGQLGFFELLMDDGNKVEVTSCSSEDDVQSELTKLGDPPTALAAVFDGPSPIRGRLVGLCLSSGDGRACYVPKKHLSALATWLSDAEHPKVGHDLKAVEVLLAKEGLELRGVVGDVGCASHLAEPSNWAPHDLEIITRQAIQRPLPNDDEVRGVGRRRKPWSKVGTDKVASYLGELADATAAAWSALGPKTEPALLSEYLELSETLIRMEQRGLVVSKAELQSVGTDFDGIETELQEEIYGLANKTFNLGSSKQLGQVLFADLGLPVFRHTKTGWSTATDALERIEHAHPIVSLVIRWRRLRRLRDTWVTALIDCIDDDGRVRSWFHPARSFSGRLVNSNPDLGRVPGRTPEMQRIRRAFVAAPGCVLLSLDFKQLGLYVLAHLTEDPALVEPLSRGDDMHTLTAAAVLEIETSEVDRDARQLGKVVNFATFAGQGASALALQLGVTAKEAKQYIARFDARYAQVRAFQETQLDHAKSRGYIETIVGRPWPIGGLASKDPQDLSYAERLARRATHEASVADVSRRALLDADKALIGAGLKAAPLLQVHDEILFEVPESELDQAVEVASAAMKTAFDLKVPLRVGAKSGANWADMTKIASE